MSKLRRGEISHSLFFPSPTYRALQRAPECPDVAEVEYINEGGGGRVGSEGRRGVEVEDKGSSRASNSTVKDLLPIR